VIEILKRLPKTNCKACGHPTCMVFAAVVAEGGKGPADCPELDPVARQSLENYLVPFQFEFF